MSIRVENNRNHCKNRTGPPVLSKPHVGINPVTSHSSLRGLQINWIILLFMSYRTLNCMYFWLYSWFVNKSRLWNISWIYVTVQNNPTKLWRLSMSMLSTEKYQSDRTTMVATWFWAKIIKLSYRTRIGLIRSKQRNPYPFVQAIRLHFSDLKKWIPWPYWFPMKGANNKYSLCHEMRVYRWGLEHE